MSASTYTMTPEEKVAIVQQVGEEIINSEELLELFKSKEHPVAYDGFEPSGQIHIAQGLLRAININKLTSTGIKFKILVADYFAMLNNKLGGDLNNIQIAGKYCVEVWKSCGMNLEHVEFVWASQLYKEHPEYWETVMKIAMNASVSRVLKCGQIMGREENTSNPSAQIMYPIMQASDIIQLGADIAQLGLDQRKVNMLARDIFPRIGKQKPVAVHHHMLLGLQFDATDAQGIDRKVAMKMSKSNPNSAVFMTDDEKTVTKKFNKAFCPEGIVEDNPVLEYLKFIVFEKFDEVVVERPEKFGGNATYSSYVDFEKDFVEKKVHPADAKQTTAKYINQLLEPTRKHFAENAEAKQLLEKVQAMTITR
jgi:tyrosyl-tRNA synthetase